MMTRVPERPLQAFKIFPFEMCVSIAMVLIGLASVVGNITPATSMQRALAEALLVAWEFSVIAGGVGVLVSILLRPWAARRLPPIRGQRTLATLRGTESASCILVAAGAIAYAIVLSSQGGLELDGRSLTIGAFIAIAVGYVLRAWVLLDTNDRVLNRLRWYNESHG